MADKDENEAPAAINAYLISRVKKLEAMVEDLAQRNAELIAFLHEWTEDFTERRESSDAYFALMERNKS